MVRPLVLRTFAYNTYRSVLKHMFWGEQYMKLFCGAGRCRALFIVLFAFVISAWAFGQTPQFLFAPSYATGMGPQSTELADMDGDGDLDVVTANFYEFEGADHGTVTV